MDRKEQLLELQRQCGLLALSMDNVDNEIQASRSAGFQKELDGLHQMQGDLDPLIKSAFESVQAITDRLGGIAHYQLPEMVRYN